MDFLPAIAIISNFINRKLCKHIISHVSEYKEVKMQSKALSILNFDSVIPFSKIFTKWSLIKQCIKTVSHHYASKRKCSVMRGNRTGEERMFSGATLPRTESSLLQCLTL